MSSSTVGAYEAKTHLPELLDRVEKGDRIVITRRGVAVAILQPLHETGRRDVREVIADLRAFRAGRRTTRKELKAWASEGRS